MKVVYHGEASGEGHIEIVPHGSEVEVVLQIADPPGTNNKGMSLYGVGQCADGKIWTRFGGASNPQAPIRILGAALEAIYHPRLLRTDLVGAWSAEIVRRELGTRVTVTGYFRQVNQHSAVDGSAYDAGVFLDSGADN